MFGKMSLKAILAIVLLATCLMAEEEMELKSVAYSPYVKIEAEDYGAIAGCRTANDCGNPTEYHVGSITSSSVIGYGGIDFGSGAKQVVFSICGFRADYATGTIQLRLDSQTGLVFGTVTVGRTGYSCQYTTINSFLTYAVAGVHNVYLTFAFSPPAGSQPYFVDIDWFYFVKA